MHLETDSKYANEARDIHRTSVVTYRKLQSTQEQKETSNRYVICYMK